MKIKETLKIGELLPILFNLDKEKIYDVEIKEHKEKRSLNANAYFWVLVGKLADKLRLSKDEVYITMLERYGQFEVFSVIEEVNVKNYFKYYKEIGQGTVNGKRFKHYRVFKGSSEYDTQEMSILIDGIVGECKEQDIETMTTTELERLKALWNQ